MELKSTKFNIYKKSAAAQISLMKPSYDNDGWLKKEGALLIEVALPIGKDANDNTTYDWKNKISFSVGINDMALLASEFTTKLVHEYQGRIKTAVFSPGQGQYEGTFMLHISEKDSATNTDKKISVPISAGEAKVFGTLLNYSIPKILGW